MEIYAISMCSAHTYNLLRKDFFSNFRYSGCRNIDFNSPIGSVQAWKGSFIESFLKRTNA